MLAVLVVDHRDAAIAGRLLEIQRRAYAVEAELIGFDGIPPLVESLDQLQSADLTVLAVVDGDDMVAMLGYSESGGVIDIDRLAVHPSHFRRGLGRMLLDHLRARHAGSPIVVSTGADNLPAVALYERAGYTRLADHVIEGSLRIANFRLSGPPSLLAAPARDH